MIDCSYSTAAEEWCYIPNAAVGDVYVLLVSNYANVHQNILIEMNDSTISNTGQIWCIQPSDTSDTSVLRICQADTLYLYSPVYDSAEYYWYGPQGFFSNDSVVVIGNIQPTSSGAYTNLVIRDSLIVYNTIYVEVEPLPESSFTAHNLGSDAAYYQILYTADSNVFYYGDGDSVLNVTFPTTLIHQYSDSGIYNATLIGFSVCGNDTVTVPMVITFASAPVIPPNTITLAPNPTTGICRISGLDGEDISLIQVRSADGRLLLSEKPDPSATVVDLTHYSPGVYFLTVQTKTETYRARILRIAQQ
jgi:PKD repeat protein